LLQQAWDGRRINPAEARRLYHLPLEELGALADRRRQLAKAKDFNGRGNEIVTYIVDRNVNYTQRLQRLLQILRVLPDGKGRRRLRHHTR